MFDLFYIFVFIFSTLIFIGDLKRHENPLKMFFSSCSFFMGFLAAIIIVLEIFGVIKI